MSVVTQDKRLSDAYSTAPQSSDNQAALVNPASGIANDYLNLFNEIVMLIEQLPTMPELIQDILAWHPVSYKDYFVSSPLPERHVAITAYAALDAEFRRKFETIVAELDQKAVGSVAAIRVLYRGNGEIDQAVLKSLCARAGENLRKILSRATSLVNHGTRKNRETAQHRVDRLMQMERKAV